MKLGPKKRAAVLLTDWLLLLLGLSASFFGFLSAFGLNADLPRLFCALLWLTALACLLFSIPNFWCRLILCLTFFAALTQWIRGALEEIFWGGCIALQQIGTLFSQRLPGIPPVNLEGAYQHLSRWEQTEAITLLVLALLGLFCLLLGWAVVRRRSFWLALLFTAPILMVPLAITLTPDWKFFAALLLFWGLSMLTRLPRKQDPYGSAKLLLLTLPPLLLLLLFMGSALPRENYTQPLPVQLLRKDLTQRAQLWGRDLVAGELTGHLAGSDDAETDLSQAGPLRFTGRTALRVESEQSGHIYLRGCSAGIYEDSKWLQIPVEAYPQMDYQPLNFPALAHPNRAATRVVVENVAAPGTFVYTPYQLLTTPERMGGAEFVADAYLARRDGIWRHILYVRDRAKPGLVLYGAAAEAERIYAQFVREQYLLVPQALQNKLPLEPLRGEPDPLGDVEPFLSWKPPESLQGKPDPLAAAQAVAERLAKLAVYDPETPAAPPGEDFVLQFLAEKRGYCMHFATVATLMLRELGVPARYVTGYVADTVAGQVVDVPDYNAHAWVEVYCDGFGWQPVEVTPGFSGDFPWTAAEAEPTPTPTPKPSAAPTPAPTKPVRPPEEMAAPEGLPRWLLWLPLGLFALLGAALLRRRLAEGSRRRKFGAEDPNRAVLNLYSYALRVLGWTGGKMDGEILALAQRAKFSQHKLTEPQRAQVATYAKNLRQTTINKLSWYKKLAFEYIFGL